MLVDVRFSFTVFSYERIDDDDRDSGEFLTLNLRPTMIDIALERLLHTSGAPEEELSVTHHRTKRNDIKIL